MAAGCDRKCDHGVSGGEYRALGFRGACGRLPEYRQVCYVAHIGSAVPAVDACVYGTVVGRPPPVIARIDVTSLEEVE